MNPHPHAELMAQYAEDAKETDKPWERWEMRLGDEPGEDWSRCIDNPLWNIHLQYRRKPRTININGYEVPEPLRVGKIEGGQEVYIASLAASGKCIGPINFDCCKEFDNKALMRGVIHSTREAAELHARALLSFTEDL